jgi:hypothetical protein
MIGLKSVPRHFYNKPYLRLQKQAGSRRFSTDSRRFERSAANFLQSDPLVKSPSARCSPSSSLAMAQAATSEEDMAHARGTSADDVHEAMYALARSNPAVRRYEHMICIAETRQRFVAAAKGNVSKAVDLLRGHLEWRVAYQLDSIADEDFSGACTHTLARNRLPCANNVCLPPSLPPPPLPPPRLFPNTHTQSAPCSRGAGVCADLKGHREVYWGGRDKGGVRTLMWVVRKHDARRADPARFVRFFVHEIESGLLQDANYPNVAFNIGIDLSELQLCNLDKDMYKVLQPILANNYPKLRKTLFVFPVTWWMQVCWDSMVSPLLRTLQPDIQDKIVPLTGDWKKKLRERYEESEIETAYGGTLVCGPASAGELARVPPCIEPKVETDADSVSRDSFRSVDEFVSAGRPASAESLHDTHNEWDNEGPDGGLEPSALLRDISMLSQCSTAVLPPAEPDEEIELTLWQSGITKCEQRLTDKEVEVESGPDTEFRFWRNMMAEFNRAGEQASPRFVSDEGEPSCLPPTPHSTLYRGSDCSSDHGTSHGDASFQVERPVPAPPAAAYGTPRVSVIGGGDGGKLEGVGKFAGQATVEGIKVLVAQSQVMTHLVSSGVLVVTCALQLPR